ncbi:DMT family transporter [Candidatus Gottesmanbacteria bacterium]|nr:DMT family transporter [Candidatus Gottesmanbacteria bacterium]
MKRNTEAKGFFLAFLNIITYGLYPVFTHYFVYYIDPLILVSSTFLVASIPLLLNLSFHHKIQEIYHPKFLKPFLIIAFFMAFGHLLFFLGTKLTSGINSGLLLQLEPFYAIILGTLFLSEKIKRNQLLATIMMVSGALVVTYKGIGNFNLGDTLVILAPVFFQIANMAVKKTLARADFITLTAATLFYSGIFLTILVMVFNPLLLYQLASFRNLVIIFGFGLTIRFLEFATWYKALEYIDLSKASALIPFAVVISFTGSLLILKERPTVQQYLGLFTILGGLLWFTASQFLKSNKMQKL